MYTYIYVPLRMNCNHFADSSEFQFVQYFGLNCPQMSTEGIGIVFRLFHRYQR